MLLVFLLVRLLSHDQVVLLRGNNTTLLFYHGQVYSRSVRDGLKNLPHSQKGFPEGQGYLPVWGLVDRNSDKYGPDPSPRSNTWVIQACSPQPDRYESWRKHTGAALLGMPLWNLRELMAGYVFSFSCPGHVDRDSPLTVLRLFSLLLVPEYDDFRSGLEGCLRTLKRSANPDINATLKVLKAEAREMVAAKIGTSYDVEKALEILVRNAIEEVGFAPRDVYNCVFLLAATKHEHACAVNELTYPAFQRTAWALVEDGGLPQESHLVVAVWPRELGVHHVTWSIGFKSNRIAKMVAIAMRLAEGTYLQQTYDLLHRIPATSAMAGQFFEAYAHRMFSTPYKASRPAPQPVLMTSDNNNPPTFSSDRSLSPPLSQSIPPPIRPSKRHVIYVGLPHDLRRVTLGGDRYYTSTSLNNPLFDSFTIDHDPRVRTVVLSIFQMTSSQKHGKSGEGYSYIQIIITHIRKLLCDEGPTTTVKPIYFLVCPEGKSENQWTMPLGWETKNTRNSPEKNMHVGDVFCIRFPGTSCLSAPNSATQLNHGWV